MCSFSIPPCFKTPNTSQEKKSSHSKKIVSCTESPLQVLNGMRRGQAAAAFGKRGIVVVNQVSQEHTSIKRGLVERQRPIIIFDVMDTLVKDPFYSVVPKFFGMTMDELMEVKHPKSWFLFERGSIDEMQMLNNFFSDGRDFDKRGLLAEMIKHYDFVANMDSLLARLNRAGYEMHICSNYPSWYRLIEEKLQLSAWVDWTFVSCQGPMKGFRKPEAQVYEVIAESLSAHPRDILLVDDQLANIKGASEFGMDGIWFRGAENLDLELQKRGLQY